MHNTHYAVVNYVDELGNVLTNYGNEDNWYSLNRIIDLKNCNTEEKEYVNKCLDELNKEVSQEEKKRIKDRISELLQVCNDKERHFYWQLSELYKELYEKTNVQIEYTVENILDGGIDDYNSWNFDRFGLTSSYNNADENIYFVEIDMHS